MMENMTRPIFILLVIITDGLATQGAQTIAEMVLVQFCRRIPVPAWQGSIYKQIFLRRHFQEMTSFMRVLRKYATFSLINRDSVQFVDFTSLTSPYFDIFLTIYR